MKEIAELLNKMDLDAYLVYDFRGSNYVGRQVLKFNEHTTRRWFAIVDRNGTVTYAVPRIETIIFENVEGNKEVYADYNQFNAILFKHLEGKKRIALEYSTNNDIAVVDIVPHGFISLIKSKFPELELVPSANLTQYISSLWGENGYKLHKEATADLTEIKDIVFEWVSKSMRDGNRITDLDGKNLVIEEYKKRNLFTDGDVCIVSTNERTGNPHYWPTEERNFVIEQNSLLLIDIWAKKNVEGAIYSDSTFTAWIGPDKPNQKVQEVWDIVKEARDLGIELVMKEAKKGLEGYQVDRIVRDHIISKGYGDYFVHRTGHSIDVNDHGSGADMDDFEKHDTRKILPDTGFSIEPGIYLPEFGVRNEIDMYIHPDGTPEVSTFKQDTLDVI